MSKYDQVPTDAFQSIVPGAGVIMTDFDPSDGVVTKSNIVATTNGGINFKDAIAFKDYAEGIDNIPRNTKEYKRVDNSQRAITISGTAKSANKALVKKLMAAADVSGNQLTPRTELIDADFYDLWIVMNYSSVNSGANAGCVAIKLKNVLHTGGFQIQTKNEDLADFAFEFTAHYSVEDVDAIPYEVYMRDGGSAPTIPSVTLNKHYVEVAVDDTLTLTADVVPSGSTVTWASTDTDKATVSGGVVTGKAQGSVIVTASITDSGITYNDTCTVKIVTAQA